MSAVSDPDPFDESFPYVSETKSQVIPRSRRAVAGIALAYCSQSGVILTDDPDGRVRSSALKPLYAGRKTWISSHIGPIWVRRALSILSNRSRDRADAEDSRFLHLTLQSINTSPHHAFVASTGADGAVVLGNVVRPHKERNRVSFFSRLEYKPFYPGDRRSMFVCFSFPLT